MQLRFSRLPIWIIALVAFLPLTMTFAENLSLKEQSAMGVQNDSCKCEAQECSSCEYADGYSFYTAKCEGGKKVKSCKKAKCVALNPRPAGCEMDDTEVVKNPATTESRPELQAKKVETSRIVGQFMSLEGEVTVANGEKSWQPSDGSSVSEGDIIQTGSTGLAKVVFIDSNVVRLHHKSKFRVASFKGSEDSSQTLLHLMYGKIRSQVNRKDPTPHFRVRTPSAVAGVRGTDFVTEYNPETKTSKVETLAGQVELGAVGQEKVVQIPKGMVATYVAAGKSRETFSDEDLSTYAGGGILSKAEPIADRDMARLDSEWSNSKIVKADSELICSEPSAKFGDCTWICKNNPAGASTCRTDLKGVACVKKRCNAGGKWADETRLPASARELCSPTQPKVAPCSE